MNLKGQITGLNDLLSQVYQSETRLSTLLAELAFTREQMDALRDDHLAPLVDGFICVIRERLDQLNFDVVLRLYGLDGEARDTVEILAQRLNASNQRVKQIELEAIGRLRTRTTLQILSRRLHGIALSQLEKVLERPTPLSVIEKLDKLAATRDAIKTARDEYETRRAEILRTVQAQLDALEAEYAPLLEGPENLLSLLEAEIKNDVLLSRATIQGTRFKALYVRGRVTWDTKGIEKYATTNPEVLKFRRQGRPSVSIREVSAWSTSPDEDFGARKIE